jgi:hypothetical protein
MLEMRTSTRNTRHRLKFLQGLAFLHRISTTARTISSYDCLRETNSNTGENHGDGLFANAVILGLSDTWNWCCCRSSLRGGRRRRHVGSEDRHIGFRLFSLDSSLITVIETTYRCILCLSVKLDKPTRTIRLMLGIEKRFG